MGPPSSGGTTVGEILNILDGYRPGGGDRARALHLFTEASALAYADRGAYLADPAYVDVPVAGLLSPEYAAVRRALIDPAAPAPRPGRARRPAALRRARRRRSPCRPMQRTGSTTHLTVADADGNVVSYTFTIEQIGGNAIVVPGRGFLLNNELTDFAIDDPEAPNRVEGGKRPRSSMAPTIVQRDGEPLLALGSPGGATIITTVAQVLLDRLGRGTPLPAAIAAPRVSDRNGEAGATPSRRSSPPPRARRSPGRTATCSTRSTRSARSRPSSSSATAGCSRRRSRCGAAAGPRGS